VVTSLQSILSLSQLYFNQNQSQNRLVRYSVAFVEIDEAMGVKASPDLKR